MPTIGKVDARPVRAGVGRWDLDLLLLATRGDTAFLALFGLALVFAERRLTFLIPGSCGGKEPKLCVRNRFSL